MGATSGGLRAVRVGRRRTGLVAVLVAAVVAGTLTPGAPASAGTAPPAPTAPAAEAPAPEVIEADDPPPATTTPTTTTTTAPEPEEPEEPEEDVTAQAAPAAPVAVVTADGIDPPTATGPLAPGEELTLEARLQVPAATEPGTAVVDPSLIISLPGQVEHLRWDATTLAGVAGPQPFLRRTGSTLQWYWAAAPLAGSVQPAPAGLPGTVAASGNRSLTVVADGTLKELVVRFTVRVAPTASAGAFTIAAHTVAGTVPGCPDALGTESGSGIDDGDGVDEPVCRTVFDGQVRSAAALEGRGWVRSPSYAANPPRFPELALASDGTTPYDTSSSATGASCTDADTSFEFPTGSGNRWGRFPCTSFGFPEGPLGALPPTGPFTAAAPHDDQYEHLIDVRNIGNVPGQDLVLYELLPRAGDELGSTYPAHLTGPVVPVGFTGVVNAGNVIVEYSQAAEPCRPQVLPGQGACTNDWTPVFPSAGPRAVTAFRIRFAANMQIAVGGRILFRVPLVLGHEAVFGAGQAAWTAFTHTMASADDPGAGLLPAVTSVKAGIRVPERLAIGNRVFRDADGSGTINGADDAQPGIAGVTVNLYQDFNGDGGPDGPAIATEVTDAGGYYLFDDIVPDANPNGNRYIVGIPASSFAAGAPLEGLRSTGGAAYATPPEGSTDGDDNGIDPAAPGQEVRSATVNLVLYSEPSGEVDLSGAPRDGAAGRGARGNSDANGDLTIDFGFTGGAGSIGNRIFLDDGSDGLGGSNGSQRGNGVHDAAEVGVNGVRVELYRDGDLDGVAQPDELVGFDVTEAGGPGSGRPGPNLDGYYLFDGLAPGRYIVLVPASEFGTGDPLGGWHSSPGTGSPATDLDDDGIEPANRRPDLSGVRTGTIVLAATGGPTGETDLSRDPDPGAPANAAHDPTGWDGPGSIGRSADGSVADGASTVTVDLGFVPPMSIGNRVWLDDSSDPAQWAPGGSRGNGFLDATDDGNLLAAGLQNPGIAGVDLQLYADEDDSGTVDPGDTLVATTTSAANGYYLFDGLAPGDYLVRIPASEFGIGQPLSGLVSSFDSAVQPNPVDQTDGDDDGVDSANPAADGVTTRRIALIALAERSGETDLAPAGTTTTLPGPQSRGRFGEADVDSDLTVDLAFNRPPMSIGNRVWLDDHPTTHALRGNGILDPGEAAVAGVEMALYRDLNTNGVVDAGEDTGHRDVTDASGSYLFGNLPPGAYIVAVTAASFGPGGPLENTISTRSVAPNPAPADNRVDGNDNGRDGFVTGIGIISSTITLTPGAEPNGEAPVTIPGDGPAGRGTQGERDADSDLTVDFGFHVPMSLGNRVWLDDSTDPTAVGTTRDDGVLDPVEDDLDNPNITGAQGLGVAGVTLRLYRDLDTDGVIDAGEDLGRTTTTDATGYYLFDGLTRGSYIVAVEASSFAAGAPLFGFRSSTDAAPPTDDGVDSRDKGVGTTPDPTFGVRSPSITLSYDDQVEGAEPTAGTETDPTPQTQAHRGANGERDAFSDLTVDFGFARANAAPVAQDDAYTTGYGTTLVVTTADDVLANDSDSDGDALVAVLESAPTKGSLTLNANGTFTYTPNAATSGIDTFTYRASDGLAASNVATVTITVGPNAGPTAAAGADQTVQEGTGGTLDGTGSIDPDGFPLAYSWTQTAGPAVTLAGASSAQPTFTAPDGPATLTFSLTVTDDGGLTATDTVVVTVNAAPTADAGADRVVAAGSTVGLDGTGSTDPEEDPLGFSWVQTAGPAVVIADADTAQPTFVAPPTGVLAFRLTVTDGDLATATDVVTITVNSGPTANAGTDQLVNVGDLVTLDATGSTDPDGDTLSSAWTQTGGTPVAVDGATTAQPTFTAPEGPDVLAFTVTVTDDDGLTSTDTVLITVNGAPTADAGPDQDAEGGDTVTLDGTGSSDPDGDVLTFSWVQLSGPSAPLTDADTAAPTFTAPSVPGVMVFELTVDDQRDRTATDTVSISLNGRPSAVAGADQLVNRGDLVTLDGTASSDPDGDVVRYQWDQTYGPAVVLTGARTATPTFVAPEGPTELRFRLIVRDPRGRSRTDFVAVVVNGAPTANSGPDREVEAGAAVTLSGGASSDPDGDTLRYQWDQTFGPAVVLAGARTATATFTAPSSPAELRFRLIVRDGRGRFATDFVTIVVAGPPVAGAGPDQRVTSGQTVALDGTGSSAPVRYQWSQTYGPTVALSGATSATPTFTAPTVTTSRELRFRLIVRDGRGRFSTDFVHITVDPPAS
jgi:VCBS repeat-containing protein